MYIGEVVGSVVCTRKDKNLREVKLMLVQKIENKIPKDLIVSADATRQAGIGDLVYLIGSKEAGLPFRERSMIPVDSSIVGFIDRINEES